MKKIIIGFILFLFLVNTGNAQKGKWITLFNGVSTDQFRGYNMASFPGDAWKVEDGALATQLGVPNIDLVTKEPYKNFELMFDWKVSKAGNSGIFFHMQETLAHQSGNGNSPNWLDNFEFQLLDDIGFNDTAAIRSAGSLYDLIIPNNKVLKPVGEYNRGRLKVKGNRVEHWLNGKKVVQYEMNSPEMTTLLAKSKFSKNAQYGKSPDGLIMLQHHGQKVWFKNIKVRKM